MREQQSSESWYYDLDIPGLSVNPIAVDTRQRHEGRRDYLVKPLLEVLGGSLCGKTVLDIGCNAGYFSFLALEAGCQEVVGVESDETAVQQAKFYFERRKVDSSKYRFERHDLFKFLSAANDKFDIVLALGIAHHLDFKNYLNFFELISSINKDLLVVDTIMSSFRCGSHIELHQKKSAHKQNPTANWVAHPTRAGLLDLMFQFGYEGVVLKPTFPTLKTFQDYNNGGRRGFIFAKKTPLKATAHFSEHPVQNDLTNIGAKDLVNALSQKFRRRVFR